MRLIRACLPLVLAGLWAGVAAGEQAQPATAQKPDQTGSAKPSTAHVPHAAHKRHAKPAQSRRAKRQAYRPEYTQVPVEVITGNSTRHVMLDMPNAANEQAKSTPGQLKVEVINGTSTDTRYFYDNGQQSETARNQPVVIGIQSSDTRVAGGNQHPVVTSITSGESGDAKSASGGGEPVTRQVSPRPKRPAYQPQPH